MSLSLKSFNKVTIIAIITSMLLVAISVPTTKSASAANPGHTFYDLDKETVYGDPTDNSNESALALALISWIPGITAYKTLDYAMRIIGTSISWSAFVDDDKPKNEFQLYKYIYKADEVTMNYWGYFDVAVRNVDTMEEWMTYDHVIGKTAAK
ncbi:hypothetical protein V1503_23815 [Bacillus sp. SCS-151]|uniref:hypothetical protein n=1 Tax=Nanhaiella sioensis TaxID=3115293 RepID=UPI003978BD03